MTVEPHWPYVPRDGWTAADLDLISADGPNGEIDALKHIELVDGELIIMSPQTEFHRRVIERLRDELERQAPADLTATREMDILIGERQRPCPDVSVVSASAADADLDRTYYVPADVVLVAEVVSKSSEIRDREHKPRRYAEAGIRHFWRIENVDGRPVAYVYELDPATRTYALTGIFHEQLKLPAPYPIELSLTNLSR
ncbi:Uma2 family endonuclease [Actinocrispum wychmicini]|uniref:Uma2 family endonuclease n=1 Tax=Actinocrispum wychmicini TaxID=1213861 RepID=A0A4R2JDN7_9PSEU|nr:Uma2 family endonuclease [Actinocrispum wychmicini]TCO56637.1 Uma2 family endonuclease [Actinocrispum wychmicini]